MFEQGGQGLQRGAGPDKLQGHFLVGKQGERRLVADHGAAALFRKEVVVQRNGFRKVVGIGGQLQHRCGVEIFAAECKAQIFDGLAVHDDVGLLALNVHHDGGLRQQQIDRHQRAGAGLGHDAGHDAGLVIQLGQEKERQCAGQDGHTGHPFPGNVAVLGINQQLGQCDGCAVRCRKAFHQHMVQRGVCERREEQRAGIAGQNVVGHQRCHGGGDCAAALYVLLAAAQLAGGFVGGKALAVGEILHPERDLQQVVQLGAQPGIGAAATLLVLQQQGGFFFLAQFQRVGQALQLELPRGALTAYNFVQRGAVDRRFAGQLGHCAGVAGDEYLQGLGQFAHGGGLHLWNAFTIPRKCRAGKCKLFWYIVAICREICYNLGK